MALYGPLCYEAPAAAHGYVTVVTVLLKAVFPGVEPDRQAARNGGGRETGAVGSGLEPQRFADTCGMLCLRAFHRS